MTTYKLVNDYNNVAICVLRSDGTTIPLNEENIDYQEYIKWLEEGNTPDPADIHGQ